MTSTIPENIQIKPKELSLPTAVDRRGNLTFLQEGEALPFTPKRVYWMYGIPGGGIRHGRALKDTTEMIVALSGQFKVKTILPSGEHIDFQLNKCDKGLLLPPMTWREIVDCSPGAVCLTVASAPYHEDDYVREFERFLDLSGIKITSQLHPQKPSRFDSSPDVEACKIIDFPCHPHAYGNLCVASPEAGLPFEIRRFFYLYDIPEGEDRGCHANKFSSQIIIPVYGSFDITVEDAKKSEVYHLGDASKGLYVPPKIWRTLSNFSTGAVCLVLTSEPYNPDDYIRDHNSYNEQ